MCFFWQEQHHGENSQGLASGTSSLDEPEQALRTMHLSSPEDDVEPILQKRQYVLQVIYTFGPVFIFYRKKGCVLFRSKTLPSRRYIDCLPISLINLYNKLGLSFRYRRTLFVQAAHIDHNIELCKSKLWKKKSAKLASDIKWFTWFVQRYSYWNML